MSSGTPAFGNVKHEEESERKQLTPADEDKKHKALEHDPTKICTFLIIPGAASTEKWLLEPTHPQRVHSIGVRPDF